MRQGRIASLLLGSGALLALALPAVAGARTAYFTGADQESSSGYGAPVELVAQATGTQIPFGGEGAPRAVAISPDGSTAYVTVEAFNGEEVVGELVPINVLFNVKEPAIAVGGSPSGVAISPDGTRAYVTNRSDDSVSVVDLAINTVVNTIAAVGNEPTGIAVTPDGTRAFVANFADDEVQVIGLAKEKLGPKIKVGDQPTAIAMTPDGTRAYVSDRESGDIRSITLATKAVGSPIPVEQFPVGIAITPDSSRAYVVSESNKPVTAVNLGADKPIGPIAVEAHFLGGVAILPDGSRAYLTDESASELGPIEIPANTLGGAFAVDSNPHAVAIVPDQPPRAAFTVSPETTKPGEAVSFDAGGSFDTDGGTVARYDWVFGDGTALANGGPKPSHSFPKEGTYTVTLTTTDDEGCSTEVVFPGQTAFCNGSDVARTTHDVTVKADCPKATGSATSFVPKFRSSRVVPGVRVRLAASDPSHLDVDATLEWSSDGHSRKAGLDKRSVDVEHWRRIRYPIPAKLRGELPLGTPLTLKLRIVATPLGGSACTGSSSEKALHVKVVKVIPGAEQHGRRR